MAWVVERHGVGGGTPWRGWWNAVALAVECHGIGGGTPWRWGWNALACAPARAALGHERRGVRGGKARHGPGYAPGTGGKAPRSTAQSTASIGGSQPPAASLDEVAIYDHALPADRVRAHGLAALATP